MAGEFPEIKIHRDRTELYAAMKMLHKNMERYFR